MKLFLFLFLAISVLGLTIAEAEAQSPSPAPSPTTSRTTFARIDPFGFIELPNGFKAKMEGSDVDWWWGSITSGDGKFVIRYSSGIVLSNFEKYRKNIVWKKEITSGQFPTTVALVHSGKTELLIASVNRTQFQAPLKNKTQKDLFMQIVSSYRNKP